MSMPEFPIPNPDLTREQALNMILVSIAMEETALSHIIEAEHEKIGHILKCREKSACYCDLDNILEVNKSVSCMLEKIADLQVILKNKMEKAIEAFPKPLPPPEPYPPPKPSPLVCCCTASCHQKCFTVFEPVSRLWGRNSPLKFQRQANPCTGAGLDPSGSGKIILPPGRRFFICFHFELTQPEQHDEVISVGLKCSYSTCTLQAERFDATTSHARAAVSGNTIVEIPSSSIPGRLAFTLLSPRDIQVAHGRVSIAEV